MPKLRNPGTGTVASCEGDLAARYVARGWVDVDAPARTVKAAPVEPVEVKAEETEDAPVTRSQTRRKK